MGEIAILKMGGEEPVSPSHISTIHRNAVVSFLHCAALFTRVMRRLRVFTSVWALMIRRSEPIGQVTST